MTVDHPDDPQDQIQGLIRYFGLQDWWFSDFNDEDRQYIERTYKPLYVSPGLLTSTEVKWSGGSAATLLTGMAGWFRKAEDRHLAQKILAKALDLSKDSSVLDLHFMYQQQIETYYKDRDIPVILDKAIEACRQQITLAPAALEAFKGDKRFRGFPTPMHRGYEQLAIILEHQERYEEAIALLRQAESQGWMGEWARRIARCEKNLSKLAHSNRR